METSAAAVARHYGARTAGGVLDAWLVDDADAGSVAELLASGLGAAATDTLMRDVASTAAIAAAALSLVDRLP